MKSELEKQEADNVRLTEEVAQSKEEVCKQQAKLQKRSHKNNDGLVGELRERSSELICKEEEVKSIGEILENEQQQSKTLEDESLQQMRGESVKVKSDMKALINKNQQKNNNNSDSHTRSVWCGFKPQCLFYVIFT